MRKALPYIFFFAWILCGCSLDTFFDGWAPVVVLAALVAIAAAILAFEEGEDGSDNRGLD